MKIHFIVITLLSFRLWSAQSVKITSYDVGAGNCTLVLPSREALPILLIDCGSTTVSHRISLPPNAPRTEAQANKLYRNTRIQKIAGDLKQHARSNGRQQRFMVVVSHADQDHYNWIDDILKECKRGPIIMGDPLLVLVGGKKLPFVSKDYQYGGSKYGMGEFRTYIDAKGYGDNVELLMGPKPGTNVQFPAHIQWARTEARSLGAFLQPPEDFPEYVLFPVFYTNDTNQGSLVLRITCDGKSCLVMGDAEDATTTHISSILPDGAIKSNILIVSHHGSSESCNSHVWLTKVAPECAVLSSGIQHRHPREKVVKRLMNICRSDPQRYHSLYFGLDTDEIDTYDNTALFNIAYSCGYGVVTTDRRVYGTIGHGDITFELTQNQVIGRPACSRDYFFAKQRAGSLAESVLTRILPDSEEGKSLIKDANNRALINKYFETKNIMFVRFTNLQVCPAPFEPENLPLLFGEELPNGVLLKKMFQGLLNGTEKLYIFFENNNLGSYVLFDRSVFDALLNLVRNRKKIYRVALENNGVTPADLAEIRTAYAQNLVTA